MYNVMDTVQLNMHAAPLLRLELDLCVISSSHYAVVQLCFNICPL